MPSGLSGEGMSGRDPVLVKQCPLQQHSPWVEGCVAGIMSSSSLSEEELWAVVPEAFFVVFTARTCSGVGVGTAGPQLRLTETGGDLIALKTKNRNIPTLIKGLVRGRGGEMGEGEVL